MVYMRFSHVALTRTVDLHVYQSNKCCSLHVPSPSIKSQTYAWQSHALSMRHQDITIPSHHVAICYHINLVYVVLIQAASNVCI